jgi:hypothetical protein
MKCDIELKQKRRARIPHELFLTNLIGNHILMFVSALGIAKSFWQPLASVPIISALILFYILFKANQSKTNEPWFIMCHWQIAKQRSLLFIGVLFFGLSMAFLAWLGYSQLGLMKEAAIGLAGGLSVIPVMVTTLALIIMESDDMHQAAKGEVADSIVKKYPKKEADT